MTDEASLPASLAQILGALIFGADHPLTVGEIRACLREVGEQIPEVKAFADPSPAMIREALLDLGNAFRRIESGVELVEVAGCFRLQTQAACSPWLRQLLRKERPDRLSRPALETLAVIAYRQPISRADIEAVRGVAVGHVLKPLVDMRLVRITGRSELPGRPFLYGTTSTFLEYFGLSSLKDLDELDPSLRRRAATTSSVKTASPEAGDAALPPPAPSTTKGA